MAYDVFISYSRKDVEIVDRIERELIKYDINCFVDRSKIDLGDDFAEIIAKSLYESELILFVWSEHSNQSENTANEIALAIDFEKTIVSFKIGTFKPDFKLSYRLVRFNRIDAADFNEPQIIELGEKVAKRLGKAIVDKKMPDVPVKIASDLPLQEEVNEDNPFYETYYQLGKQALLKFNFDTAFTELLEPALNNYKDSQELFFLIVRGITRIWTISENNFGYVLEQADQGNAFAQCIAARYYGIRKHDNEKEFYYARKSAEQNSSFGLFALAKCYDLGIGTPKNNAKYMELSRKAVSMNNISAIVEMAKNYLYGWTVKIDVERGLNLYQKGMELEDAECINDMGVIYWEGDFVEQDIEKAEKLIKQAISLGYIEGYESLGKLYLYAPDTYEFLDVNKGFDCFMKGAEYSEANCLYQIAFCYDFGLAVKENKRNALKWYERAAKAGSRAACCIIGRMYYYGDGVDENNELAWDWFVKGHKMVDSGCFYMLGVMCLEGYGQEGKEKKEAIPYFEESAFLGGHFGEESLLKLYDIYQQGEIVEKNEEVAIHYLKKAAEKNNATALFKYGTILTDMNSPYSNELKGVKYLQRALDKQNYEAALPLAKLLRQGIGMARDIDKAKELLLIAAEKVNSAEAYCELGKLYSHATQSDWDEMQPEDVDDIQKEKENAVAMEYFEKAAKLDYAEAYLRMSEIERENLDFKNLTNCEAGKKCFEYITKAAEKEYPQALLDMGVNYQCGIGIPVDKNKAIEWYKKAYQKGLAVAAYNIAGIYNEGKGVKRNIDKALHWYKEAQKSNYSDAKEKIRKLEKELHANVEIFELEKKNTPENRKRHCELVYPADRYFRNSESMDEMDLYYKSVFSPLLNGGSKNEIRLPEKINCLFVALKGFYEAIQYITEKQGLRSVPFHNVDAKDLYPFVDSRIIWKIKQDIVFAWFLLKEVYEDELSSISLSADDDSLLDIAEASSENHFVLGLITLVETRIELDGAEIYNAKLYNKIKNASSDDAAKEIFENIFTAGDDYISSNDFLKSYWSTHDLVLK